MKRLSRDTTYVVDQVHLPVQSRIKVLHPNHLFPAREVGLLILRKVSINISPNLNHILFFYHG